MRGGFTLYCHNRRVDLGIYFQKSTIASGGGEVRGAMMIHYEAFEGESGGEGIVYKVEWAGDVWLRFDASSLMTLARAREEACEVARAILESTPGGSAREGRGDVRETVPVEAVEGGETVEAVRAGWRVRVEVSGWIEFEGGVGFDEGGGEASHGLGRDWLASVLADEEIDAGRLSVAAFSVLDRATGQGIRGDTTGDSLTAWLMQETPPGGEGGTAPAS